MLCLICYWFKHFRWKSFISGRPRPTPNWCRTWEFGFCSIRCPIFSRTNSTRWMYILYSLKMVERSGWWSSKVLKKDSNTAKSIFSFNPICYGILFDSSTVLSFKSSAFLSTFDTYMSIATDGSDWRHASVAGGRLQDIAEQRDTNGLGVQTVPALVLVCNSSATKSTYLWWNITRWHGATPARAWCRILSNASARWAIWFSEIP